MIDSIEGNRPHDAGRVITIWFYPDTATRGLRASPERGPQAPERLMGEYLVVAPSSGAGQRAEPKVLQMLRPGHAP